MAEAGVDISSYRAKSVGVFIDSSFDYVVTMCADAQKNCPIFPGGTTHLDYAFTEPAVVIGDVDQCGSFRCVRDQIKAWIDLTFGHGS